MALVDVHVHLAEYPELLNVLDLARANSMLLVSCTVRLSQASEAIRTRNGNPGNVRCFVGVHPSDVTAEPPSTRLAQFLELSDGIGEIGLDDKYGSTSEGSDQFVAFIDQLGVAERMGMPVQIHSRGSERRCFDVLSTFNLRSVLMHWFESEALLPELISKGYFASVGPSVLYSKRIRRIARGLPADRILTESDGPVPFAPLGGASGPNLIASVVFGLAEARGTSYDDLEEQIWRNAKRFLLWKG